jgi:hypothetical protein
VLRAPLALALVLDGGDQAGRHQQTPRRLLRSSRPRAKPGRARARRRAWRGAPGTISGGRPCGTSSTGVVERVAMTVTRHRTRRVFDAYHIVSPSDLQDVAQKIAGII